MIGVVAVLTVDVAKVAEFEAVFAELATQVRAQEAGNLLYQLTRSRAEPGVYKVLELYTDAEAVDAHRAAAHYKAAARRWGRI